MKVHIFDKKQVLYVVLAIILLCIGMVCALRAVNRLGAAEAAAGITDWGLSFQSEGAPPVANASQEYLRNFDALYVGDANKKEIYITFDAGFENGNTERILDALKKHGVKATFFLVGNYFETQPELVKRMAEEATPSAITRIRTRICRRSAISKAFRPSCKRMKRCTGTFSAAKCRSSTARRRANSVRKTSKWRSSSGIPRCFGALPMSIGIRMTSPHPSRHFLNYYRAFTPARSFYCTARRARTPKS